MSHTAGLSVFYWHACSLAESRHRHCSLPQPIPARAGTLLQRDSLASWLVQCYATKPCSFKVNYNHDGHFDRVLPSATVPVPFGHIRIIHYRAVYPILQPAIRYTVHIIYTNMMCHASHRSVVAVTHSFARYENEYTVLINTDPWWVYLHNHYHPFPPSPHRMTYLFTTSSKKIHNSKKNCNFVF